MGSIQANRVPKGKRLPGHMGNETVTIQKLEVVKVDAERNVILVKAPFLDLKRFRSNQRNGEEIIA